ncbi:LamG-like jellyroll fold domain-containing protein [Catenuloplanes japonicus]|uniref:LamG-like jellyroll fold domain-containing protein n=1 Tax=Catenuloplanes japonicus TaxID=33876 RepID=UPI000525E9C6|nr:LamG-like jellyroll fold domain-containing protein [Catenuloplanes japonicus]
MKLRALGLTAVLAATGLPAPGQGPLAPIAHYTFDGDDLGGVITDSSGNGLHGTLVNGKTAALEGGALVLPGGAPTSDGAYVTLPRDLLAGRTDLTVSVRLRWDGTTAPWQWAYALGTDNTRYLFSTPYNGNGRLRTAVTVSGGGAEAQVTGAAPLPANVWKTLTVTLDTAADRLTTYLDGVAVASAPTAITAGELLADSATVAGYIGRSFYPDPLFDGAVDDFRVYGAALTAEQVAAVHGGPLPTLTGLEQTAFAVRTAAGTAPALPATVTGTFSDGYDRQVPITWAAVDPSAYAQPGTFTVTGSHGVTATVTVIREGQLIVDLDADTGPFHGGASGSLYGLYGPDVPTNNLIEGMRLRTVSTKAQDGPQHPGADALEVVKPLADSTDGDVYIYMTDIHRGFPYQWPGSTPAEKMALYTEKISKQVDQVLTLDATYRDNIVFVPFNEPEGNMFGTGEWSYNGVSWLTDPTDYFRAWDDIYRLIKTRMPDARIAGPNTSILFPQVRGFLEHTKAAGTVPDVMTWHELSHPEAVRTSVVTYRAWEAEILGRQLPININEYAFNYHTSVPGQMIQWISAIEESKVDADIAYWNIDGNISDSAVRSNRGNGQWWLFNAYGGMTGHTVRVSPPYPGQNYTLQGVATLDPARKQARLILGGASGKSWVRFDNVRLGRTVHAEVREIPWTGQIGDSAPPRVIASTDLPVRDGSVVLPFGDTLPALTESSAYEVVLSPGPARPTPVTALWENSFEAEDAVYTGAGYSRNGPEGSPADVSKFYTSGGYDVGGLRTGSDGSLAFTVDVPRDGDYDLSVFANSLNTYPLVAAQGPTNVFLRVDGAAEQELFLPLGYKWVVWDHTDTRVTLTKGRHTVTLAARSLDGTRTTTGDAIIDRIRLTLANPAVRSATYRAEYADLTQATVRDHAVDLRRGGTATFWVYSPGEDEATIRVHGDDDATLTVNGRPVLRDGRAITVALSGGINKVTVTGRLTLDRIEVTPSSLPTQVYQAEAAATTGSAAPVALSLADGGHAVDGIGGPPGNGNTLTFTVSAARAGVYAMRIRYANPEQAEATHYNPDPLVRHADVSVNGATPSRVTFPHSFHRNNFWELTVPVTLQRGSNTITFAGQELPNFDGVTYASDTFPGILLRAAHAPIVDRIALTPLTGPPLR